MRRSLLLVAVTGEEKGLLGSRYFSAHPTVAPDSMVADLNLDMFLPLYPMRLLTVYGLNESDLGDDVRKVAKAMKWICRTTRRRSATCSSAATSTTSSATAPRRS